MTFLFLGSGLDSLNNSGSGESEKDDGDGFYRSATQVVSGGWAETPEWSAETEVWAHFFGGTSGSSTIDILYFMDGSTVVAKLHKVSGNWRMSYLSAAETFTQVGDDFTITGDGYFDVYFKSGASGAVGVYFNGVEQMTASASMTHATDVTKVRWLPRAPIGGTNFGGIAVRTEPTIGGRVCQGYMSGAGASTDWTGTHTDVDEIVMSEADYIYSGTADQVETYAHTLAASLGGYIPIAVGVSARAKRGSSGPASLQLALRSGGTNYFSGSKSLGLGYAAVQNIWETNPDTSLAFTSSQLSALQPGVKSIT